VFANAKSCSETNTGFAVRKLWFQADKESFMKVCAASGETKVQSMQRQIFSLHPVPDDLTVASFAVLAVKWFV
jgi:hypothetical protein